MIEPDGWNGDFCDGGGKGVMQFLLEKKDNNMFLTVNFHIDDLFFCYILESKRRFLVLNKNTIPNSYGQSNQYV